MKLLMLALVVLVFAGCTMPVTLRHPVTGHTVKCGPYSTGIGAGAPIREARCIDDYQRQGYERVPE